MTSAYQQSTVVRHTLLKCAYKRQHREIRERLDRGIKKLKIETCENLLLSVQEQVTFRQKRHNWPRLLICFGAKKWRGYPPIDRFPEREQLLGPLWESFGRETVANEVSGLLLTRLDTDTDTDTDFFLLLSPYISVRRLIQSLLLDSTVHTMQTTKKES